MSIFNNQYIAGIGMFALGTTCYSKPLPITIIDLSQYDEDYEAIEFYTPSGYLLERFYVNLPNTIFTDYEFVNDRDGCVSFKFTLSEYPKFQIFRFTRVVWKVKGKINFTGYIENIPLQGDDRLSFSGFGMAKRLDKSLIVNPYANYQVKSISKTDAVCTMYLYGNMPNIDLVGLRVVVRGCQEDKNNTRANAYFTIDSFGGVDGDWYIVYNNAGGLVQTVSLGVADILPAEWSFSNLRSTIIDYCIRHLTRNQVKYNPLLIEETTGYITSGTVNFHGMEFSKFIKEMREALPERMTLGVNEEGYFFLKNQTDEIIDKFFEEFDFYNPDLKEDLDKVVNNISIMREGDGKKWSLAALASDSTSIALYGELTKKVDIPYAIEDSTAQMIANVYLANNKDPKYNITIKERPFEIKKFGYYGIVTKANDYVFTIENLDTLSGWITENGTATIANTDFISGSGCHNISFNSNCNHYINYADHYNCIGIKKIGFYIQSNISKLECNFIVNGKILKTEINITGYFIPIEFELIGFDEIKSIQFVFVPGLNRTYNVKIDNIFILQNTNIHYSMPLRKQTWKVKNGNKEVEFEYGMLENNKLADFVGNTNSQMSNNTLMIRGN